MVFTMNPKVKHVHAPTAETHTHTHNDDDPYAFIFLSSHISSSQEELLRHAPFVEFAVGDSDTPNSPVADEAIFMVSPPDTSEALPQDVFHTPPEDSSLPSSDDQRRTTTLGSENRCAVNHAVDVDAGTQGFVDFCGYSDGSEFVDLGRDSELGFSEAPFTQEIDVPECSRGDGLGKIPNCQLDEFRVLERDLSDFDESPVKKSKISGWGEGNAENPCDFGEDQQLVENVADAEKEDCCKETSMENENLGSGKNFETETIQLEMIKTDGDVNLCESDKLECMVEENKSSDGVVKASGIREKSDEGRGLRVLPPTIGGRLENAGSELECEKVQGKEKCSVFDVLKVLSENSDEDEDNDDGVSLLEYAKRCGVTFARPRWWPDHFK